MKWAFLQIADAEAAASPMEANCNTCSGAKANIEKLEALGQVLWINQIWIAKMIPWKWFDDSSGVGRLEESSFYRNRSGWHSLRRGLRPTKSSTFNNCSSKPIASNKCTISVICTVTEKLSNSAQACFDKRAPERWIFSTSIKIEKMKQ